VTRAVLLTLLYATLTIAMAAPWSLHPSTRVVVDNPDSHLFLWALAWDAHALVTDPVSIFDANIYHPYPNTLAYSENLIGSAVLAAPIIWITGSPVLALSLVSLLSCMLCGVGAFVLGRRIGLGVPAAIIAGIIFAFAPTRFYRMSQMHLNAVQWLPFGLAWLHAYFDHGRAKDLRIAIGFLTLQALTAGHGAVFLGMSMLMLSIYRLALGEPLAILRRIKDVGVTGALLIAPAVLVWLPYRRAQNEMGLRRTLDNWRVTSESAIASPTHVHQFLLSLVSNVKVNESASAFLFPGYLVLLLGGMALLQGLHGWDRRGDNDSREMLWRSIWFYALLALLTVLLIVDQPLGLWPYVYSWPGLNFIRVPSRFIILTTLALAMLAGAGFERIAARKTHLGGGLVALIVGALLLGEYSTHPFTGNEYAIKIPAIVRWLDTLPKPFVVAEVPVPRASNAGAYERFHTSAMLHSTAHWQKTIHGYSGIRPPLHDRVFRELNLFPDDTSIASLRELGVTHVVVHRGEYRDFWPEVEARLRQSPALRFVHAEADGDVYEVVK
jgi:hypothetical protein